MRRSPEEAAKTRECIFQAGLKLFADRGYAATRLEDIARAAGTTRGAIYWHFKNKQAFFHEVYRRVHEKVEQIWERTPSENAVDALRDTMVTVLTDFIENDEWRLMCSFLLKTSWLNQVRRMRPRAADARMGRAAAQRVRRWISAGQLRQVSNPALIGQAAKSYLWGLMMLAIDEDAVLGHRAEELVDLFLYGIAQRKGNAERPIVSRDRGGRL